MCLLTHCKLKGSRSLWLSSDAPEVLFVDAQIPNKHHEDNDHDDDYYHYDYRPVKMVWH